jgi:AraC family transcriptional regulator
MLVLTRGEYFGSVSSSTSADGVLIGITEYQGVSGLCPEHYHENPHLSFVLKGTMFVKRKELYGSDPKAEQISYMHAGQVHQNAANSARCKNMNLELEPDFFSRYNITESEITPAIICGHPGSVLLMVRLYKELSIRDDLFNDSIHMLLLGATAEWKSSTCNTPPSWVKIARELLQDQWNEPVSLQQIASTANVHPVTVSKYFVRYFGTTFGEYRRKLKIERAVSLLTGTCMPLTEVGYACGFFDQSHFTRAFKDHTAWLPKDLRRL